MRSTRAVLRKRRGCNPAVPRPVREVQFTPKFTCNRHPYHAASAVVGLFRPLLRRCDDAAAACVACSQPLSDTTLHQQLMPWLTSLESAPATLEVEGPLYKDAIQQLPLCLSNSAVESIQSSLVDGALASREHHLLERLWPEWLRVAYGEELVREREAHVQRKNKGVLEPRYEAGRFSQEFFEAMLSSKGSDGRSNAALLSEWSRLIDSYTLPFPDRSRLHELENLPQEIMLGEIVADCIKQINDTGPSPLFRPDCLVDVGGGNGFITAAIAERLGTRGVVVDPYYPPHSIDCCPSPWADTRERARPPQRRTSHITRVSAFIRDVDWQQSVETDPERTVLIAKHLCGSGIDECLLEVARQGALPKVLVLAPCCFPKIDIDRYTGAGFLRDLLGVKTQRGFDRIGRVTDWNMSSTQHAKEAALERDTKQRSRLSPHDVETGVGGSFPYRRVGSHRSLASVVPCMHALSQLVEALVNHGRVLWLERNGYTARVYHYVPNTITPKCKCIVAVKA